MKSQTLTTELLADLAQESEIDDPIDWSNLKVDKETAYKLMASNVLEQFESIKDEHVDVIALSTITKLLVENFVLNLRLEMVTKK